MPHTHVITHHWADADGFYNSLSGNSRIQLRKKVLKNSRGFAVQIINGGVSEHKLKHLYELYLAVKDNSLAFNTFPLPLAYFEALIASSQWELVELSLPDHELPCCCVLCCHTGEVYIPMIIGLNYEYNRRYNIYRQALYQVLLRAKALNACKILFGFSASIKKQKPGAMPIATVAYVHSSDSFNTEQPMQMREAYPV